MKGKITGDVFHEQRNEGSGILSQKRENADASLRKIVTEIEGKNNINGRKGTTIDDVIMEIKE